MNTSNTYKMRKLNGSIIGIAYVAIVLLSIPIISINAQGSSSLGKFTLPKKPERDTADKTCRGQFCGRVIISPSEISISSDSVKGDTVVITLELSNRTDTAITGVWKVYDIVPPYPGIALDSTVSGNLSEKRGPSLLASEGDSLKSSGGGMSLSTWLTGFPDSVVIEPHSTIKMNVVVKIPNGLKEGTYTGWLGATSEYLGNRPPPQEPILLGIISRVKITYEAKAANDNTGSR